MLLHDVDILRSPLATVPSCLERDGPGACVGDGGEGGRGIPSAVDILGGPK